jgi:putative transposase
MKVRGSLRQVKNAKQFFCDFLPEERRLIRRDGIRMFNIFYWSNILTPLAGRSEKPVLVKYDPRDLSRIYLRDEESGDYWDIPYRDLRLPPISLWEQQAATKQLHAEGRSVLDEKTLFEIVEEQRRLEEGARKSTRARRATVTRRQSGDVQATASGTREMLQSWAPADGRPIQPFEVEEWD